VSFLCHWYISYYEHKCRMNYLKSEISALYAFGFSVLVQWRMDKHLFRKKRGQNPTETHRYYTSYCSHKWKTTDTTCEEISCLPASGIGLIFAFIIVPPRIDMLTSSNELVFFSLTGRRYENNLSMLYVSLLILIRYFSVQWSGVQWMLTVQIVKLTK
jgi:hypothetical protein